MPDQLIKLNRNPFLGPIVRALGLPSPTVLARCAAGYAALPLKGKSAVLLRSGGAYAAPALLLALRDAGAQVLEALPPAPISVDVLVFDASGCERPADLRALYDAFHPVMRRIARNGRVFVVAPEACDFADPVATAVARGVEGFVKSLGKELGRKGVTANLAYVGRDAVTALGAAVRFFCGPQTTYVSGQAVRVTVNAAKPPLSPFSSALAGKVAVVTGAARGIGMATAERLVQEGAQVICVDVPAAETDLLATCQRIGATPLAMDIAAADTPAQLGAYLTERHGGVDIFVHNAGITRDRTLGKMSEGEWDLVMQINLAAIVAIDQVLLHGGVLRDHGRIVCLSSISGIAGNVGQTNYATTKAALIGYVAAQATRHAARGITVNAVAPGFIETAMTKSMPFMTREVGRRLNALQQAGEPRDVAELVTFLATPGAYGLNGQTIRVCGLGLVGA